MPRNKRLSRQIRRINRWQILPRIFAAQAVTTGKTTMNLKDTTAVTNGFKDMGSLLLNNIDSPMGTLDYVDDAGVAQTAANNLEMSGQDIYDQIYTTYRVKSATVSLKWWAGTSVRTGIGCIPSFSATSPVASWYEAMNHPLRKIQWSKFDNTQDHANNMKFAIDVDWYYKEVVGRGTTESMAIKEYTDFGASPTIQLYLHFFKLTGDATIDTNANIVGVLQVNQKVLMKKTDQATDYVNFIGDEAHPEFET